MVCCVEVRAEFCACCEEVGPHGLFGVGLDGAHVHLHCWEGVFFYERLDERRAFVVGGDLGFQVRDVVLDMSASCAAGVGSGAEEDVGYTGLVEGTVLNELEGSYSCAFLPQFGGVGGHGCSAQPPDICMVASRRHVEGYCRAGLFEYGCDDRYIWEMGSTGLWVVSYQDIAWG